MKKMTVLLLALIVLLAPSPMAMGGTLGGTPTANVIYGLTASGNLVTFAPNAPQTLLSSVAITGLSPGEMGLAIDFRPATQDLYLLGSAGRLYRLDEATGVATLVGTGFTTALVGNSFGFDFNPTVDRIRITSDSEQNLRAHPDTGAVVSVDGLLHYADGDPNEGVDPVIVGSAYSNNFFTATTTTLYGIDAGLDVLVIQNPPNDGTLVTVGGLGVDTTDQVGFDIRTGSGVAYASLTIEGNTFSTLYTIDLGTGLATAVGNIGGTSTIVGIAIPITIKDTVGVYDPATAAWFLRNSNTPGGADLVFTYGAGGSLVPVDGDYNNDGVDTPGVYDPATGSFLLRNSNSAGPADLVFTFGAGGLGFVPLIGDWDGNGTDTVGVYDPATGTFFLRNANSSGGASLVFSFGPGGQGFVPIVGDWDGDGDDTVGVYSPATAAFFLRNSNSAGGADIVFTYGPTGAFVPVVGDFDNSGNDTVGIYDPATGAFFLRYSNSAGPANLVFTYGPPGFRPLIGNWDGI